MAFSLATLPLELLDCIAENTDCRSLLSLCKTDRRMNQACLRWIYRTVALDDIARAIGCFQTLISNENCAHAVRTLTIRFGHLDGMQLMLGAFYRLLRAAIKKLKSLESLALPGCSEIFGAVSDTHFPRLRDCRLPFCADIVLFLQMHPKLVRLSMDPVPEQSVMAWTSIEPIHLPNLHVFGGPELVALSVIPRSSVSQPVIFWDPRLQQNFEKFFRAVASSGTTLHDVQNILVSWEAPLLAAMAKYGASLTSFTVRNVSGTRRRLDREVFFAGMDDAIPSLRGLMGLSIIEDALLGKFDCTELDWELEAVRRWGDILPTLSSCILPSATKWLRMSGNVWYPSNQQDDPAHLLDRFHWFVTTVVSSSELPAEYMELLETVGGREMVQALVAAYERDGSLPELVLTERLSGISVAFTPA